MINKLYVGLWIVLLCTSSCQAPREGEKKMQVEESRKQYVQLDSARFGTEIDGQAVKLYTLTNKQGSVAYLTNFGARLVGLVVPDKHNTLTDVVLGFDNASAYNNSEEPFFGTIVGPFGNRIANGRFTLEDKEYRTVVNNGPNTLHGGFKGVHFAIWDVHQDEQGVLFSYLLPHLQEGFPGNIEMKVRYTLDEDNTLTISYEATTDKKTVINLTNHAYFNLNGEGKGTILDHELQLYAEGFTPVDSTLIPTGEIMPVKNTAFDFTKMKTIGRDIAADDEQLRYGRGYDHNFVLKEAKDGGLRHAATLKGDVSGIIMDLYTEEPGLQFYSGNFMADKVTLKGGETDSFRTGLCLEPQHFPDSPNQKSFPSVILNPGDKYTTKSVYRFSVDNNK
ncbi:galactose mutarotase [Sphingobacterium sp. UT-1RO-CII-1]|uniref:aldose epimerase family protein n=1 Tax=Sphingobacterium sp. UT-1RO-CII-1 TaxID=2995225 RepID=UPI00227A05FA|nr:aldose epimerase family protein [Sphingobacterium sp. UT-1RO-CII-1]MCY4778278.1 galactose mutarotase [Sphingobacterium sp. UT-1RO-CII-1]